ncbi:NADH-quinone oxidoreductase subunit J [bacterium]|nr:NADH-quinone oxidoreductase subunit J [bacterium]
MSGESIIWWVMAALAVAAAAGMVTSKNPVHSALWLVVNFIGLAMIYLVLSAPMLFAVQLIVYAGAIMVLFLFVVWFFMSPRARQFMRPPLRSQLLFGGVLSVLLLGLLAYAAFTGGSNMSFGELLPAEPGQSVNEAMNLTRPEDTASTPLEELPMGHPRQVGTFMFSYHVLPFTLTSLVLLAALLGALMVARDELEEGIGNFKRYAAVVTRKRVIRPLKPAAGAATAAGADAEVTAKAEGQA